MRPLRWLVLGGVALAFAGGCAGKSQEAEGVGGSDSAPPQAGAGGSAGSAGSGSAASMGGTSGSSSDDDDLPPRVPEVHRAAGEQCDDERAPGNSPPYVSEDSPECTVDSDCEPVDYCSFSCRMTCLDTGAGKRCAYAIGECTFDSDCTAAANGRCSDNRGYWSCSYDKCFNDSECSSGGPCACGGAYGPDGPNTCMAGNCQIDADCGDDGYCSPTQGDCGSYSGIIAYYCHTPQDTCVNDSECSDPERGAGYCMYRPELGHWQCGYGQCVG
jgi:hypothetical protein